VRLCACQMAISMLVKMGNFQFLSPDVGNSIVLYAG